MEDYTWWAIAGIALVIAELVTGTFYLLMIGVAAFAGAAASYLDFSFRVQAVAAAAVATAGVLFVNRYRATQRPSPAAALDVGQSVVLDSWVSEKARHARVRYRNALWDAQVLDEHGVETGHVLYIQKVDGSTLHISTAKPV